jgi:hypothetical protein
MALKSAQQLFSKFIVLLRSLGLFCAMQDVHYCFKTENKDFVSLAIKQNKTKF